MSTRISLRLHLAVSYLPFLKANQWLKIYGAVTEGKVYFGHQLVLRNNCPVKDCVGVVFVFHGRVSI